MGALGVGVLANRRPQSIAPVPVVHHLIEEEPEPTERVGPHRTDNHAARQWKVRRLAVDHQPGLRPGFAVVIAGRRNHECPRAVLAAYPYRPQTSFRSPLDADRHPVVQLVVVVLRQGGSIQLGRNQCQVDDSSQGGDRTVARAVSFRHFGLVLTHLLGRHGGKPCLRAIGAGVRDPTRNQADGPRCCQTSAHQPMK